ncbi:MAG: Hsp20/alpha crystallin family protein [Planctomycetia bacterium]|nr:Hsp20/alpha crystallin family protein [Planctomycetia bacterium]
MLPLLRYSPALAPTATGPVNRLDSFFDRVFGDDGGFMGQAWSGAPLAMWEDDDRVGIEAEFAGVAEQDLDITVHNGVLFIRGQRKPEEGRRYFYNSRPYGRFERVVTLPDAVNTDDVQATLKDGVLRIELPKSPEAKPRKIELKTS